MLARLLQSISTSLLFGDRASHWPGAHHVVWVVWPASPGDCEVSVIQCLSLSAGIMGGCCCIQLLTWVQGLTQALTRV